MKRDIWEVSNQLMGYVSTHTDKDLAEFLIREGNAAADLAYEIVKLRAALKWYADPSKYKAPFTGGMGELYFDCGKRARTALEDK